MTRYDAFKRKTVMKAIVVPLLLTALVTSVFFLFLPSIEERVPNINTYSQQEMTLND